MTEKTGNVDAITESLGFDAVCLAVVLRGEAVVVAFAAAPPETRTAAVLHVEEPLDGEVAARTAILVHSAHLCIQISNAKNNFYLTN